jgi:predicted DNA-binding protein
MNTTPSRNDYQLVLRLPTALNETLRQMAVERGVSLAAVIREALRDYLERHEGEAA